MPLTPNEIEKRTFEVRMRGYDRAQVHAFLGMIAEETANLITQKHLVEEERVALKQQIERAAEREKKIQDTLLALRELTEKMKDDARREGELILRESRFMAAKILEDARVEAVKIEGQIGRLRMERDSFDERLRSVIDEHQRILIARRQEIDLVPVSARGRNGAAEQ
jgi:cell division initiation protein